MGIAFRIKITNGRPQVIKRKTRWKSYATGGLSKIKLYPSFIIITKKLSIYFDQLLFLDISFLLIIAGHRNFCLTTNHHLSWKKQINKKKHLISENGIKLPWTYSFTYFFYIYFKNHTFESRSVKSVWHNTESILVQVQKFGMILNRSWFRSKGLA